ncbi:MAG: winged helix-turn-helix domain-containing protein [Spirochaetaceae bacterium]|nr:MAG: winged helix-turn-helix domain-containing protein [Spirochaetaceae bacterium]
MEEAGVLREALDNQEPETKIPGTQTSEEAAQAAVDEELLIFDASRSLRPAVEHIVKPETNLDAPATVLPWWRVEKTNQDGPVVGKGVSVRLAGPRPDFLKPCSDTSENPATEGGSPSPQLLFLLSSAPEPVLVSVKQLQPLAQPPVREDGRYAALLRGITRAELTEGAVALPVMYEPYCTRIGILRHAGQGKLRTGSRLRLVPPDAGPTVTGCTSASDLYATVGDVYALPHGLQLVVLSRSFPLLPGTTLLVGDPSSSARSESEDRAGRVTVLGCYPRMDLVRTGAIRELVGKASGRPSRPMSVPELYHVMGVCARSDQAPPAPDALCVGSWWVSPALLARCEQALVQRCRRPGGARSGELRHTLHREGIGPALGDALLTHARARVIERRGSVWLPAGAGADEFLSLPARTLLARVEAAGSAGIDGAAERALTHDGAGVQLVDYGLVILLENGRLFSVEAYQELALRTRTGIRAADGELHQRSLAEQLGLSRNSTRALVARMVHDGLIERASAVHVRTRADGGQP